VKRRARGRLRSLVGVEPPGVTTANPTETWGLPFSGDCSILPALLTAMLEPRAHFIVSRPSSSLRPRMAS
jgi:hypothetical protein